MIYYTRIFTSLLLLTISYSLIAQSFPECTGLPPSVTATDQYTELFPCSDDLTPDFGTGYYIDGDHAFLGSPGFGTGGVVYHYQYDGSNWQAASTISASDAAAGGSFGSKISVDGNRMAISSPGADGGFGAIYLFEYDGTAWIEQLKIAAPAAPIGSSFGTIFDIDGDSVLAVIFNKQLHVWQLDGNSIDKKYVRKNGTRGYNNQVSVEGEWLIAVGHSLKILRFDGDNYKAYQTIPRPSKGHPELFVDLEIHGDRMVCGQPEDNHRDYGRAFISTFDGTAWSYPSILNHFKDGCASPWGRLLGAKFGRRVSLDDERVLIYSDQDKFKKDSPGILNIYDNDPAGGYTFKGKYVFPEFENFMRFGQSHEMDAGRMIAVAPTAGSTQKRAIIVDFNEICLTPTNATATAVPGGFTFSWDPEVHATNYNLTLHTCTADSALLHTPVFGNSITITGIAPGTSTRWYLQSVCGVGNKSVKLRKGSVNWLAPREAEIETAAPSSLIGPNPTSGITYLKCEDCELYPQAIGTDGRMYEIPSTRSTDQWQLDLSSLPDGLYTIVYNQEDLIQHEQILIVR